MKTHDHLSHCNKRLCGINTRVQLPWVKPQKYDVFKNGKAKPLSVLFNVKQNIV
uniref:Uncharacterized protein n=1 Tax=Anguilla anguilla TaxID=7936 RepID=A0A0E9SPX5_ANGAN